MLAPDGLNRMLIARDYSVSKAFEMYQKWVDWRIDFKADQIDPNSVRHLLLKETMILHRYDKARRYCLLVRPRFHTPGGHTLEELIRYGIYLIEQAMERTEAMGST